MKSYTRRLVALSMCSAERLHATWMKKTRDSRACLLTFGFAGLLLGIPTAHAGTVIPQQEYDKYIDKHRTIQALDSSLFGEQINLRDGGVQFKVVDAELPGNGPTIRIVRTFRLRPSNRFVETTGTSLAGWMLEVPRMKTITNYTTGSQWNSVYGWQVPGTDKNARCTNLAAPSPIIPGQDRYWDPHEWWSGYQVVDDLGNEQELLRVGNGYPEVQGYKAVSSGNWRFSCIPLQAGSSELGEGFLGTAPDGTRYWFDHLVYTSADTMTKPMGGTPMMQAEQMDDEEQASDTAGTAGTAEATEASTMAPAQDVLYRRHAMLLVTRVEDRFGNWLTYQYSGAGLTRIDASDGRVLQIQGTSPTTTVSLGSSTVQRTWSYLPSLSGAPSTVTLPDGSKWTYDFDALTSALMPSTGTYMTGLCALNTTNTGSTVQGMATSPSGVTGTFMFMLRRFGRSYVLRECMDPDGDGQGFAMMPADWFAYALTQRSFSGPGIVPQTWTYTYSPANASWSQDCASGCADEVWADVTDPEGVRQRTVFSNRSDETENLMLREETYDAANVLARTIRHDYATSPASSASSPYAWPKFIGEDLQMRTNRARSERWAPTKKRQIEQQQRTFTWEVPSTCDANGTGTGTSPCFDKFARPTKVVKSSAAVTP